MKNDLLIEILTEELPPKSLLRLAENFCQQIKDRLQKVNLSFGSAEFFATPRRLAVLVHELSAAQPDQLVERKGPALNAAFDKNGNPSQACIGFAKSCGVEPQDLLTIKQNGGEWVGYKQQVAGKTVKELIPDVVKDALQALPIPKRMRWGDKDDQFIRPVHGVILLYGDEVIPATILSCEANRVTFGHRFQSRAPITISTASAYASLLNTTGYVMVDFIARREKIRTDVNAIAQQKGAIAFIEEALLDEVTGLVEWAVALCGQFDADFLHLPPEILISAMQDHQRYFAMLDKNKKLLPYFITISNIISHDQARVIQGNERVLRARLADAAFFYAADKKESLEKRVERLKGIVFQAKLGTLYDKTERLQKIMKFLAKQIKINAAQAERVGLLAKADLTTDMVNEFPELQGVMGYYYALNDGEAAEIAEALKEQYMPRFAGDELPKTHLGEALAIADRLDTLVGVFGINQLPTGDKDPYGLRRAALGVLRILIENKINLDLKQTLDFVISCYKEKLPNPDIASAILNFMQERSRAWYHEQGIGADVFAAVSVLGITNPLDMHARIQAVQAFKQMQEAESLSVANKRVSNILAKYKDHIEAKKVNPAFFENAAEQELARQLAAKDQVIARLSKSGSYTEVLLQLAELRKPIDDFFAEVMVMTEDKSKRENRLLLLSHLRALFLQVADIALLQ